MSRTIRGLTEEAIVAFARKTVHGLSTTSGIEGAISSSFTEQLSICVQRRSRSSDFLVLLINPYTGRNISFVVSIGHMPVKHRLRVVRLCQAIPYLDMELFI